MPQVVTFLDKQLRPLVPGISDTVAYIRLELA